MPLKPSDISTETIDALFSAAVTQGRDHTFLWTEDTTVTYGEAAHTVDQYATLLADRGIGSGDHVGALLTNCPAFVFLMLATARVGATFVPFDYRQEGEVLEYLLSDAAPALLVVGERARGPYDEVADAVDIENVFYHGGPEPSISRAVDATEATEDVGVEPGPLDIAVINYTSGSTGPPKGVKNPHRAFVEAGSRIARHCDTTADDRGLVVLPLFHANPQTYALMHMLSVGGSIALVGEFSASGFWPAARDSGSTFFTHVGSVLEILNRTVTDRGVETETPLSFTLGGAAQFDAQESFETETGIQVIRLYGLSEMGAGVVTMNPRRAGNRGASHQGPIGPQPFDVGILDPTGTDWVETGQKGEIVIRPDRPGTMFTGYLDKEAKTVQTWRDLWMHTGDLGWVDESGNLHYVGRLKTSIRKNGENVSPWEVETVTASFAAVKEAVAVGVEDTVAGEEIKLCVVPADATATERGIYERCRNELPDHLVPRYVEFLDALPRTSTQKVERMTLTDVDADTVWDSHTADPS